MKFVRFLSDVKPVYGIVEGNTVRQIEGSPFTEYAVTTISHDLANLKILPPCEPGNSRWSIPLPGGS